MSWKQGMRRRQFVASLVGSLAAGTGLARVKARAARGGAKPAKSGASGLEISADFPGGNIVLERVDGHRVFLRQDLRDTEGWWFYWYFAVRKAAGRELQFHFTNRDVFTSRGPAVSTDAGRSWQWLGREQVEGAGFRYRVPAGAEEVRFCLAMPYLQRHLDEFLGRHGGRAELRVETHCRTRKGRVAQRLHLGRLDGQPAHRVLLTCRHHACEMMASWVLEGLLDTVLGPGEDGQWFRRHVEIAAIPFMDKDGVEDGDQGKNRRPLDHNRDYLGPPIYPSVAALKVFAPRWSQGKCRVALDLHCPYIRGLRDENIFLVGQPDARINAHIERFSAVLAAACTGPLPYDPKFNIPFGTGWNTEQAPRMFSRWAATLPGVALAAMLEFPYATAGGKEVNVASARRFGQDLARAVRRFLETLG